MTPEQRRIAQLEYEVSRFKSALLFSFTLLAILSTEMINQVTEANFQGRQFTRVLAFIVWPSVYFLLLRHIAWKAKRRVSALDASR